ncbi:30S ribosomal protein S20 [Phocaeicola plebeius CAG:211]|uniref:Small ribosomal subunit protein bS20 n=2 Tax=Phocaeicola TaxID=909656 RepID=R5W5F2_9BACT|nr:30S ribosomal protein S20 [Phocaeicola plebeius CAG:211]
MANHKSSIKRIRQEEKRRLHNRYYAKTMRNAVKKLRATTDKAEAVALYPSVQKMLDKLAKRNIIHANKAANLKSKLAAQEQSCKLEVKTGCTHQQIGLSNCLNF